MSLDRTPDYLPNFVEQGVQRYAEEQHITHDEAVVRLIQVGLKASTQTAPIKGLSSEPMSDEEAKQVDEALEIAMEARRARI